LLLLLLPLPLPLLGRIEQQRGDEDQERERERERETWMAKEDALQGYACLIILSAASLCWSFRFLAARRRAIVHDSNRNGSGAGVGDDDESCPAQTWSTLAAGEAFTYRASYVVLSLLATKSY